MRFSLSRFGLSFERAGLGLIACAVLALYIGVIGSQPWVARGSSKPGFAVVALNWDLLGGSPQTEGVARDSGHDTLGNWAWLALSPPTRAREVPWASAQPAKLSPVSYRPVVAQSEDTSVSPQERKEQFIAGLLPLIIRVNEGILQDRSRITRIRLREGSGVGPNSEERAWLGSLFDVYEIEAGDYAELLRRHDIVPPSLAIAQGAEESGWGTSRFAVEGNALFGRVTVTKGAGIVPARRDPDQAFEIRAFDDFEDSVADYVRNLNRHAAYREFRARREAMRVRGVALDSHALATTLNRYSERREKYIQTIRTIIRSNDLTVYDSYRLSDLDRDG